MEHEPDAVDRRRINSPPQNADDTDAQATQIYTDTFEDISAMRMERRG